MIENITTEQLRVFADDESSNQTARRSLATELLAFRAERAKPTPSDEERAASFQLKLAEFFSFNEIHQAEERQFIAATFASIHAEGSAERAKLKAALRTALEWIRSLKITDRLEAADRDDISLSLVAAIAKPAASGS